ncbi:MAG: formylglycine-generating enzyme family protein [Candidatus Poseidoniales archaeon]|tara:strand:+ start:772 stop:1452 length:681 start_codon:yes stop_codon:yes gene_type:complete
MRPMFSNEWGGTFTLIEPGEFTMGDSFGNKYEKPQKIVKIIQPFFISLRLLTQVEWSAIMDSNPSKFQEGWAAGLRPVETITWHEGMEFIDRLNRVDQGEKLGLVGNWRLPTEEEWEFSCRAGSKTRWFHSNADHELDEVAWHAGNSGAMTREVGQKKANEWGIFDMHGNVSEWTSSNWQGDDLRRVHRGGSWFTESDATRSAARASSALDKRSDGIGMRLVWSPI